jgi:hypothetical protein
VNAEAASAIQKFITSPPGQLTAGALLAGLVWQTSERVEGKLKDNTKFELAVWLVGVNTSHRVAGWSDTCTKIFDQVFGVKYLSWKCFIMSALVALANVAVWALLCETLQLLPFGLVRLSVGRWLATLAAALLVIFVNFLLLIKTRFLFRSLRGRGFIEASWVIVGDALITLWIGMIESFLLISCTLAVENAESGLIFSVFGVALPVGLAVSVGVLPLIFTSAWLWLYVAASFLISASRRFDKSFAWFNSKFDIEKNPLSAIGLVAGAMLAVAYWGLAIALRFI